MCKIEELGYSRYNKHMYCTECIIYNQLGKCEYLKWCESEYQVNDQILISDTNSYTLENKKSSLQDWDKCHPNYLNPGY